MTQDDALAAYWYEKAAAQGDPGACYLLASLYENGHGVVRDIERAWLWYAQAAARGEPGAEVKVREMQRMINARADSRLGARTRDTRSAPAHDGRRREPITHCSRSIDTKNSGSMIATMNEMGA